MRSPHRASPDIVHAFITGRFAEPFLTLSETGYQELLATVAAGQILGGPAYDALIFSITGLPLPLPGTSSAARVSISARRRLSLA